MACEIVVTRHAMDRYRERVANVPDVQIFKALSGRAFDVAARIGAPFVKLSSGHRALIKDGAVITVLPKNTWSGVLRSDLDDAA